jgi:microcystin-dependent protein|tara:strand:- start:3580 stop:5595 length:2016 start_codon:yes stop_codon:yes gene_type:complete
MAYTIAYTDQANKGTITVEDNTINTETGLGLPGRNATAYGTTIASNFLHILENFASATQPSTPVEGQLWYDTAPGTEQLKVYDGTNWVASGGLKKASTAPQAGQSLIGDLWVDTDNQQLYLFSGSGWVLVGPNFSDGLVTGALPITVIGTDDLTYNVLQIEVDAKPVALITTKSFTPKVVIPGFSTLSPGINLSANNIEGAGVPKFYGTAEKAEGLIVSGNTIAAGNFLRGDVTSTTAFPINVQNNTGINYGINAEMNIGVEGNAGVFQHNIAGSSMDFKVKNDGILKNVLRLDSNLKVGVNNVAPDQELDVTGNIQASGLINTTSTVNSTTFSNGSIRTAGGLGVSQDVNIGGALTVTGITTTRNVLPNENNTKSIGSTSAKYANIYATTFVGNLTGNVSGTVSGRAGSADRITSATTFRFSGDITAADVVFDGQTGGTLKVFNTSISNDIVAGKTNVLTSQADDEFLINRTSGDTGLKKINRINLFSAIQGLTPVGTVVSFAGGSAPIGWLICDGTEYLISQYGSLYGVVGTTYKASPTSGFFALPDLRGRFLLGPDNMGGTSANVVTSGSADVVGAKDGAETITIATENLPEHEHDLRGESGDQYYATRDVSGTPNDNDAIIYDSPTGTGAGQAYPASGGVLTDNSLGQAISVMNPYMTMNFIIYTGG